MATPAAVVTATATATVATRTTTTTQEKFKPAPSRARSNLLSLPLPPAIIRDEKNRRLYTLHGLVGTGGFARCYAITDENDRRLAAKVVAKISLSSKALRDKLRYEVHIHSRMNHFNIVNYEHSFVDRENVYIILELCENKSMLLLVKKRGRLNNLEVRYFITELLAAVEYLHSKNIIHRDLKLANLFLTHDMHLKVGDFGLATEVMSENERKKTICGTPNYIAPEVFDQKNGHSFEVDIWAIGVIMFTMLVGHPPFQTSNLHEIYERIKTSNYEFPSDIDIQPDARHLIDALLQTRPETRPVISAIMSHPFFTNHPHIRRITTAAFHSPTVFAPLPHKTLFPALPPISDAPSYNFQHKQHNNNAYIPQPENIYRQSPPPPSSPHLAHVRNGLCHITNNEAQRQNQNYQPHMQGRQISPAQNLPAAKRSTATHYATDKHGHICVDHLAPRIQSEEVAINSIASTIRNLTVACDLLLVLRPDATLCPQTRSPPSASSTANVLLKRLQLTGFCPPRVFIARCIDYTDKYGLGYQLTDGTVGVYFNDSTTILLAPNGIAVEYIDDMLNPQFDWPHVRSRWRPAPHDHSGPSDAGHPQAREETHMAATTSTSTTTTTTTTKGAKRREKKKHARSGCNSGDSSSPATKLVVPEKRKGNEQVGNSSGWSIPPPIISSPSPSSSPSSSFSRRHQFTLTEYPQELNKKVLLLKHFRDYMNRNMVQPAYMFADTKRVNGLEILARFCSPRDGIFAFLFASGLLQVNFRDHSKIILSYNALLVTFSDTQRNLCDLTLAELVNRASEFPGIVDRLHVVLDIVRNLPR